MMDILDELHHDYCIDNYLRNDCFYIMQKGFLQVSYPN